jgi:DUF4097 and DUF4098 domain-containing protein YvlB
MPGTTTRKDDSVDLQHFDLPVAVTLRLQSRSGKIDVVAEPREDVVVEGDKFDVSEADDGATLEVRAGYAGSKPLSVRCPAGTDIAVGTQSGPVHMQGEFGTVSVTTMSGSIDVERADEADLRSGAGNVHLGSCGGRCRMNSMSGSIIAGAVGAASAGTVSGSITIERVTGRFKARSVSGTIKAACNCEGAIAVKTVSGKVYLELPTGTALDTRFKTLSGKVRNPFPAGHDCQLEAMSISGSIELVPA